MIILYNLLRVFICCETKIRLKSNNRLIIITPKIYNVLELDVVDSTPAQTDSDLNYFNSQIDDKTRTEVFGLNQRRLYYAGQQFSRDEITNLQKKITDMYEG